MSLTIDEVLERISGQYSRFQMLLLLSMAYIYMSMAGFHLMVIAFIAGEPNWECVENSTICNFTEAVSTVSKRYKERCSMPRSEWKFTDTYTSTVTEFDLVCEDSILQSVASSTFWIGWFVGNIVMGYISDKLGRKKANQWSVSLVFCFSWISIWPKELWVFMVCRFIIGIGSGGATMCAFITVMEFSASRRRGMMGSAVWLFSPFIFSMIGLFAYLIREWRYLLLVGATLGTPVMIYIWFIPETPRFLLVNGKYEEARNVLEKIARWNKKEMPQDDIHVPKQAEDERADFRDLFYNKSTAMITLMSWLLWFTTSLMFYAVSYNSVYLGGNIFIGFFLTNVILFPAIGLVIVLMKKYERKKTIIISLLVAAVSTVITVSIPADRTNTGYSVGRIITAMIGKGSISISFTSIYVQGAEVFPTTVRNIAMGTSSSCARIGSFVALYIIWLQRIHRYVPYVVLGVLCLISAITFHIWIPETKNVTTPEVIAPEAEKGNEAPSTSSEKRPPDKAEFHPQAHENPVIIS